MKRQLFISLFCLVLGALLFAPVRAVAADNSQNLRERSSRRSLSSSTGMYAARNASVAQGVTLTANALYYYGDIDMLGYAFQHGFQRQNLSLGGSLVLSYLHPWGNHINWRFSVSGGYIHGNDSARYEMQEVNGQMQNVRIGKGSFDNAFGELFVGVEWYPFPRAGFYIYGGFGMNVSFIDYDFTPSGRGTGSVVSVLPMLPIEIGYNINLTHGFYLTIMASVHQGLLDVPNSNLDAYPLVKSSRFQWGDGYFTVGLNFSYRWQKCEPCRWYQW